MFREIMKGGGEEMECMPHGVDVARVGDEGLAEI